MPTFHFHFRVGDELFEDPIKTGKAVGGQSIEVTDEAGRVLATVALRDVVGPR